MKLSEIQRAVANRVDGASDLLPLIHDRKGDGTHDKDGELYATLKIVPLENREPVYCDSVLRSGFILVNVYAPDGYGALGATLEAEKYAALFPEGQEFDGVRVPDVANIREPVDSEQADWFYVSTVIYFEA